jgi:polar amino acid transport system substrate-binding protein
MRRKALWCWALTMAVLCFPASQSGIAAEKVYINGFDANFPPFSYVDKSGNPDGFDVKALDWIAKEMGFKVKHLPMDWDGVVPSLKAGKIDIVASGMSITDERKQQVSFTTPYWKIKQVLVARKDAKATAGQALAGGNKIGVQRGTTEAKWIEENLVKKGGKKFELVQYDSAQLAIEDVINGRIMAAAIDDAPARDAVKKKLVKILGGFGMADEFYGYAVRKEDVDFLRKVNEGLKKLMKSSHWAELKKTYIDK